MAVEKNPFEQKEESTNVVNIEVDRKERGKGIGEYVVNMLSD